MESIFVPFILAENVKSGIKECRVKYW